MSLPIHQRDERYPSDPPQTLCLKRAGRNSTTESSEVTCPLCLSIARERTKIDAEVASGKFWDRFK